MIEFLRYVYFGELEIQQDLALDLYELAHKWQLEDLKTQCLEYLKKNLQRENVTEIAQRAENMEELCQEVIEFLMRNENFLEEKDLEGIPDSILRKIICQLKSLVKEKEKSCEQERGYN